MHLRKKRKRHEITSLTTHRNTYYINRSHFVIQTENETETKIKATHLRFGIGNAAAACIGGGTLYGKGNLAATAGFSNNIL